MKKKLLSVLCLVFILALAGCTSGQPAVEDTDSDVEYIKNKGTLVVGITDFAPMDYLDDNGEWIGFDADLVRVVAKSLGIEVEFVEIDWDNKLFEIQDKNIDVIWNGMTLTDEVLSALTCSKPYLVNAPVLVVSGANAGKYANLEDIKDINIAVEAGSSGEGVAKDNGLNYRSVLTQADTLLEVSAGTSDASIIDLLMAGAMIGENTSFPDLVYTVAFDEEYYGVGCRKDSDLAAYIDGIFEDLEKDGSLRQLAEKYGVEEALVNK
jgi:polar amino acid transport system substrate-binding protein